MKQADMAAQSTHERTQKQATLRDARLLLEDVLDEQPAFTVGDLQVNGRDLMELGAKPGPAMGLVLKTLLNEVQDEILPNTRDAQLARAKELL
jgi:tRNA nucleotidyltransferase (CCA-adding enzyme)